MGALISRETTGDVDLQLTYRVLDSPGYLVAYNSDLFSDWRGYLRLAGLSSQAIVRIETDGGSGREVERFAMGARIRSVVQGPGGELGVLEDESAQSRGRLLRLTPKSRVLTAAVQIRRRGT